MQKVENLPYYNQACGHCFGGMWQHPNDKCKKFVNKREHWEAAKAANEFDPRQAGTRGSI